MDEKKSAWNSLEISKLVVAMLTPTLLFALGFLANSWVRRTDLARSEREEAQTVAEARANAVRAFSQALYGRRTRAEMVVSALRRGADLDELRQRKHDYDNAYVEWNTNHMANLLTIREVASDSLYTEWERSVEFDLVSGLFSPLDACITRAYDARMQGRSPRPILDQCDAGALLQRSLDCGHAVIEGLYRLTGVVGRPSVDSTEVRWSCSQ